MSKKYEYLNLLLDTPNYKHSECESNKMGQDGWELVQVHFLNDQSQRIILYFKREITQSNQTT